MTLPITWLGSGIYQLSIINILSYYLERGWWNCVDSTGRVGGASEVVEQSASVGHHGCAVRPVLGHDRWACLLLFLILNDKMWQF